MNLKSRVKMFDAVHDYTIKTFQHETPLALGGRSMGARAAVLASMPDTKYLILASYPLQTAKETRDQILLDLPSDNEVLFISGNHDSMCDLTKLDQVRKKMKAKTWLIRVRDADHGMNVKPKKATRAIGEETGMLAVEWLDTRRESETEREVWWEDKDEGDGHVNNGHWAKAKEGQLAKEVKEEKGKTEKTTSSEEGSKSRKKGRPMAVRTAKDRNDTNGSKHKQRDKSIEPVPELRRSKRRKVQ